MCSGGGKKSAPPPAEKPAQPYRNDPEVRAYYDRIMSARNAESNEMSALASSYGNNQYFTGYTPENHAARYNTRTDQSKAIKVAGVRPADPNDYDTWEEAYYLYQKDKTAAQYADQARQQQEYMNLQKSMGEQQLAMQQQLQQQQIESQERLTALQQQMQQKQLEQQKVLEEQRLQFEKDASVAEMDNKRNIDLVTKQAKLQETFQAGRKSTDRKNSGSVMATRGTKALQVGVNAGTGQTAGLGIPA